MKEKIDKVLDFLYDNLGMVIYVAVWMAMIWFFWEKVSGSDAFGYGLFTLYLIFPICSLVVALYYGLGERKFKFYLPLICGVLEMMIQFCTFDLANRLSVGKWTLPDWTDLQLSLYSLIPALVGLGIGSLIRYIRKTKVVKKK